MTERSAEQLGHLDEGTIHAWLDGALSADEARAAEAHVAGCAECAAAVAEARGLIAGASRILLALDDVPGGVLPASRDDATPDATAPVAAAPTAEAAVTPLDVARRARRPFRVSRLRVAAGILIAALGTTVVVREASRERTTAASDSATFSTAVMRRESRQAPVAMTLPAAAPPSSSTTSSASPAAAAAELAPPPTAQRSQIAAAAPSARPTENVAVGAAPSASSARIAAPSARAEKSIAERDAAAGATNAAADAAAAAPPAGFAAPRRAMARATEETRSVPAAKAAPATGAYIAHGEDSMVARAAVAAPAAPPSLSVLRQAATPRPVTVAGVVRDVQGNPLPGVSVTLGKLDVGAVTDSAGHYAIVDVPPGRYVAQARRIGYAMATSDVAVAPVAGRDTTAGPAFTLAPRSLSLSEAVVTGVQTAPSAAPAQARRKAAGAVAGGAGAASAAERAAAGCYDLGAARPALGLPMQIVLDTARASFRDDEGVTGRTVRTPGAGGGAPAGYPHAYWQFVGDEVLVFFLDARDAGVVLRARASAAGLRGTASVVAPGRPDVPVAGEVVAPRCGR